MVFLLKKKAYFAALLDSLPLPVSSVWKLVCGCRLKYFLSIHYCIITLLTPPFIFQISIPTFSLRTLSFHTPPPSLPRSFSQFLSLPSHSSPPPHTLFHHILPLSSSFFLWFIFTSHHSPLSPLVHRCFPRRHKWTGREWDLACLPIRVTLPRALHRCIMGTLG